MKLYTFKTDGCMFTNFGICEISGPRFGSDGQPKKITFAVLNRMLGKSIKEKVTVSTLRKLMNKKRLVKFGCQRMGVYKGIIFIKYYDSTRPYSNYFIITPKITNYRIEENCSRITEEVRKLLEYTWLGRRIKKLGL